MSESTFITPITEMSDRHITNGLCDILKYFDVYSRSDPFGWDWPTMRMVFPELCDKYNELHKEAMNRLRASSGRFDGRKYIHNGKGWVPLETQG